MATSKADKKTVKSVGDFHDIIEKTKPGDDVWYVPVSVEMSAQAEAGVMDRIGSLISDD